MLKGDHTDNLQPVYRRETAILNRKINGIPVYSGQVLPNLNLYMCCILLFKELKDLKILLEILCIGKYELYVYLW